MDSNVSDLLLGEARSAARHLCTSTIERQQITSETFSLASPSNLMSSGAWTQAA